MRLYSLFELRSKTRNAFCKREVGLRAGIPELASEAAQVVAPSAIPMIEARHIHVRSTYPVVVVNLAANQLGRKAAHRKPDLLGEVTADDIRRISDAVRITGRSRVEQNTRRIHARSRDNHSLRQNPAFFFGMTVEVLNATRQSIIVDQHARSHRVVQHLYRAQSSLPARSGNPMH